MEILASKKHNGIAFGISFTKGSKAWYTRIDFWNRSFMIAIGRR